MISFDVKNLFTNVPLDKTIKIILRKIYQDRMLNTIIPQKEMEKPLMHKTCYIQLDRVAMGSPLGPVLPYLFELEINNLRVQILGAKMTYLT